MQRQREAPVRGLGQQGYRAGGNTGGERRRNEARTGTGCLKLGQILAIVEERDVIAPRVGQAANIADGVRTVGTGRQFRLGCTGHLRQRERAGAIEKSGVFHQLSRRGRPPVDN